MRIVIEKLTEYASRRSDKLSSRTPAPSTRAVGVTADGLP